MLHMDSECAYKSALKDLVPYYDKVKESRLMMRDNYNKEGVKEATEGFSRIRSIKYNATHNNNEKRKIWFNK